MAHPTLRLRVSTDRDDYTRINAPFPDVMPSYVSVVTDTGAQSCLWSLADFYRCGFSDSDLLSGKRAMVAANQEEIEIVGAIFIRLSAKDNLGNVHSAAVMVYVSPSTNKFYLSREALVQLGVISRDFPRVGAFVESCPIQLGTADCGCERRSLPPARPTRLPFRCCPENNAAMRAWLIERYSQSTFNKCPHQKLDNITGPELQFHIKPSAKFKVAHTPAMVALHDQEEVKAQLDGDVAPGVLEKVPYNEPSIVCHRMHIVRKPDGSPRRVVDMSSLNEHCLREIHYVNPRSNRRSPSLVTPGNRLQMPGMATIRFLYEKKTDTSLPLLHHGVGIGTGWLHRDQQSVGMHTTCVTTRSWLTSNVKRNALMTLRYGMMILKNIGGE